MVNQRAPASWPNSSEVVTAGATVPQLNKTMNAKTAECAGTATLKLLNTENIDMFRHPKYYKELRKLRNKLNDHSGPSRTGQLVKLAQRVGLVTFAWSGPQASSFKRQANQATSHKRQAPSNRLKLAKPQASSALIPEPGKKFHGPRTEVLYQDKTVTRMLNMKCNLMWRKTYLVTLRNFKFYCEKGARIIVAQ